VRRLALALLAIFVLPITACGGGSKGTTGGGGESGASVIPRSAPFFLKLDTSFDSPQWTALNALLKKFPGGDKVLAGIAGEGVDFDRDVKPALGPEFDLIALSEADLAQQNPPFLGLTQPKDTAKFEALVAKDSSHPVSEEIAGWRVISDKRETIDRLKQARNGGVLADNPRYKAAADSLPAASVASVYIDGPTLTHAVARQAKTGIGSGPVPGFGRIGWLAGAFTAEQHGFGLDLRLQGDELEVLPFAPQLPAQLPADVTLLFDVKGLDRTLDELRRSPAVSKQLGSAEKALGALLDEVIGLFKGETAITVRQGLGGKPELTLVVSVADETAAKTTVDKLATLAGAFAQNAPEAVQIAGVSAQKLSVGKTTLYYAVFDGKVVVTNAESGISGLRESPRLADSQGWRAAADAAGLPDQTAGLLYADVPKLLPLLDALSRNSASGRPLSDKARRTLEPLTTALLYGSVDGDVLALKGFVGVR
jgi:hypothetical protein